jgi:hypothetical protein
MTVRSPLQEKLRANQLRLARRAFIAEAPAPLATALESANVISGDALDVLHAYAFPTRDGLVSDWGDTPDGHGWRRTIVPPRYQYAEFSWAHQATAHTLQHHVLDTANVGVFLPFGRSAELPGFRLSIGVVLDHFALHLEQFHGLLLMHDDCTAGVVITAVLGRLPGEPDPPPHETIFEVGIW